MNKKSTKKKNAAAQALVALRWQATTAEQRAAHAEKMGIASAAALTHKQRTARAKKAAAAKRRKSV